MPVPVTNAVRLILLTDDFGQCVPSKRNARNHYVLATPFVVLFYFASITNALGVP